MMKVTFKGMVEFEFTCRTHTDVMRVLLENQGSFISCSEIAKQCNMRMSHISPIIKCIRAKGVYMEVEAPKQNKFLYKLRAGYREIK